MSEKTVATFCFVEKWGETPMALWFLAKKCDVLRSYRFFGVTPMVGKEASLTLRLALRVIQLVTCCAHIFCCSWRKFPPDLLYFTTLLGSVPKWSCPQVVSNVSNLPNLSNEHCWGLSPSVPAPPHRLYTFYMFYMVKSFGKMGKNGERPQRRYGFWPRNALFCAVIAFLG